MKIEDFSTYLSSLSFFFFHAQGRALSKHGDEDEQFSKLWDYGQELRTCNPGSTFLVSTHVVTNEQYPMGRKCLKSVYWSYDACKRGWL